MRPYWIVLLLVILLAGVTPAQAEIVTIESPDEESPPLIEPEEIPRIEQLQNPFRYLLVEPLSPDDEAVLAIFVTPNDAELVFLNVNDGSTVLVEPFLQTIFPLTNLVWLDETNLVGLGVNIFAFSESDLFVAFLINRETGDVEVFPIGDAIQGLPINLAPDASKALVISNFSLDGNQQTNQLQQLQHLGGQGQFEQINQLLSPFKTRVQIRPERALPSKLRKFAPLLDRLQDGDDEDIEIAPEVTEYAVVDLETLALTPVLTLPENSAIITEPAWTPDGSKLAITRTTFEDVGRGEVTLGSLVTQDTLGSLPPAENPLLQGNAVEVFDLTSGTLQASQLRAADGNGDLFLAAAWSPDGQTLMTQMGRPAQLAGRTYPIYTLQFLESGYLRFYNSSLQEVGAFDAPQTTVPFARVWFVGPDELIINSLVGPSLRIYYHNRATGEVRELSFASGSYSDVIPSSRRVRQVIFVYSSFINPPEVYRIGWDGQALAALTYFNVELQQQVNRVQFHEVRFTLANGAVREGFLVQPADQPFPPQDIPLVIWQEGGPGVPIFNSYAANVENPYNLLPNFGISVLVMPFSGRPGFGPQFYNDLANGNNFGAVDIDEAAQVARQMITLGWTSSGKLGITGCSYGGYFVAQSIARHPDLYAAANPQCGLYDNFTEWQTGFQGLMSYLEGTTPAGNPLEYAQDSPGYIAGNVRNTATLIFHGTDDFLPINIAESYHDALEQTGSPVRMVQFVDEGHGLGNADNQLYAAQEQISWFRQYLR